MKNLLDQLNTRSERAEERICKLKIGQLRFNLKKRKKTKYRKINRDLWDITKCTNVMYNGNPRRGDRVIEQILNK